LEEYGDWATSLRLFLVSAQMLAKVGVSLFKDSRFFSRPEVIRRFNAVGFPKDERALMLDLVFGSRYYKCWTQQRLSIETDDYACADPPAELLDESLGEAAERQLVQVAAVVSVLSAPGSAFHNKDLLKISKLASAQVVDLRNASALQSITRWIVSERGYYDLDSQSAPRDFQTVLLKDPDRFRATAKMERRFSRRIFQEIATGRLGEHGISSSL
jgi:hypothetical protein